MKRIGIAVVITILLLSCLTGCGSNAAASLEELLDLGQRYLLEENYDEAIIAFEKAIAIDKKCEKAYIGLADAYMGKGDVKKALSVLEEGYKLLGTEILKNKHRAFKDENYYRGSEESENIDKTQDGGTVTVNGTIQDNPNYVADGDFLFIVVLDEPVKKKAADGKTYEFIELGVAFSGDFTHDGTNSLTGFEQTKLDRPAEIKGTIEFSSAQAGQSAESAMIILTDIDHIKVQ